eukprot:1933042-Lingulodinium_polyedra.AAC.1
MSASVSPMTVPDSPPIRKEALPPSPDAWVSGDGAASPPPLRQEALPPTHDAGATEADTSAPSTVLMALSPAR